MSYEKKSILFSCQSQNKCNIMFERISTIPTEIYRTKEAFFRGMIISVWQPARLERKIDSLCSSSPDDKTARLDPKTLATCQAVRGRISTLTHSLSLVVTRMLLSQLNLCCVNLTVRRYYPLCHNNNFSKSSLFYRAISLQTFASAQSSDLNLTFGYLLFFRVLRCLCTLALLLNLSKWLCMFVCFFQPHSLSLRSLSLAVIWS